jgi:hypothetical protein
MTDTTIGSFQVTTYYGETDGVPVVQVDGAGHVRVNVNDAPVFDRDTEANASSKIHPTVRAVSAQLLTSDYVPSAVLAQIMSAFATSTDAADLVDTMGGIFERVAAATNLPTLDVDDEDANAFWTDVAIDGGVLTAQCECSDPFTAEITGHGHACPLYDGK